MGHRAYYLDETQDGWNVYYSQWGAKELFYDGAKNNDVKLGRSMNRTENREYFDITSVNNYALEAHYSAKKMKGLRLTPKY